MTVFSMKEMKNPLVSVIRSTETITHVMSKGKALEAAPGAIAADIKCPMCKSEVGYLVLDAHNQKWKAWACTNKNCITENGDVRNQKR